MKDSKGCWQAKYRGATFEFERFAGGRGRWAASRQVRLPGTACCAPTEMIRQDAGGTKATLLHSQLRTAAGCIEAADSFELATGEFSGLKKVRARHAVKHVAPSKSSRKVSGFSSPGSTCVELEAPLFNPAPQQPCGV